MMKNALTVAALTAVLTIPDWSVANGLPEVVSPIPTTGFTCQQESLLRPGECMTHGERGYWKERMRGEMTSVSAGAQAHGFGVSATSKCKKYKGLLGATEVEIDCPEHEARDEERGRRAVEALFITIMGGAKGL